MNIDWVNEVFFSPTRTTKRIIEAISQGTRASVFQKIDLTPPGDLVQRVYHRENSITIIGAPVYGGRIPQDAVRRLRRIRANGEPAVVVAVYGNRDYEDALRELQDLATELGFMPIAGATFIGEHSFHNETAPIAAGRPDVMDLQKAQRFGSKVAEKVQMVRTISELTTFNSPGRVPYKEFKPWSGISPVTDEELCTLCKTCERVCPMGATSVAEAVMTDKSVCILCSACVKNCPSKARVWQEAPIVATAARLSANCGQRKEPELFL